MKHSAHGFDRLIDEHQKLIRQYGRVQNHCSRLIAGQAAEIERLQAQVVRMQAQLILRDTALAWAREDAQVAESILHAMRQRTRSILCVGQDVGSASAAQQVAQMAGARFLHHAGDTSDDAALENSLRAADLVICQTGCVSHNTYWRVQDHCKRTGKQCVLVDRVSPESPLKMPEHLEL